MALSYLVAIFSYSGFLAETLLSEPSLAMQFAHDRNFTKLKSKEDLMQDYARFSTTNPDPWPAARLARFSAAPTCASRRRTFWAFRPRVKLPRTGHAGRCDPDRRAALLRRRTGKRCGQPLYDDSQGRIARGGFSIISLGKLGGTSRNRAQISICYFSTSTTAKQQQGASRSSPTKISVRLADAIGPDDHTADSQANLPRRFASAPGRR